MANLFLGLYYNFSVWFKLTDHTYFGGRIAIVGSLITVGINLYFIPLIGIAAPAWASLFCYGFMAGATFLLGKKYYPIQYPIKKMAFYLFFTLMVYAVFHVYKNLFDSQFLWLLNGVIILLTTLLFLFVDKIFKRINILQ
jgi:O-antigen/teichoic acid export membrane protein